MTKSRLLIALALGLSLATAAEAQQKPSPHEMIASANPYASAAGLKMMKQGGSAVDAAIAAQMVLTLVEPELSAGMPHHINFPARIFCHEAKQ